jgi:hypothetical protein
MDYHAILEVLTPLALFVLTFAATGLWRTADKINKTLERHADDINMLKTDVATLKEWRSGSDARQREVITAVHDLRDLVDAKFRQYDANILRFYEEYELTPRSQSRRRA